MMSQLAPGRMIAIILGVVGGGVLIALAVGASPGDLPWGAIILALLLAGFIALRSRRLRRQLAELDDEDEPTT